MFKIGDKLRIKSVYGVIDSHRGFEGIVVDITVSLLFGVAFSAPINYGHDCDGKCAYGYGYYYHDEQIELVDDYNEEDVRPSESIEKETNWREDRYNFYEKKGWL